MQAFCDTLPEFKNKNFQELLHQANRVVAKYGGLKQSINVLEEIQNPVIKKKCFVLSADIAMASGEIGEAEENLLEAMQRLLGIDDTFVHKVVEVLHAKYAT